MATIGIACGGTGGHLYPGLAVAEKLQQAGHQVIIYVSPKKIDQVVLKTYSQFQSVILPTVGWTGLNLKALNFCFKFFQAYALCVKEIRHHQPAAILGMGGFSSAPMLIAAARRGIPVLLHESNAIPGKVTKLLATQANKVLLGFEECADYLKKSKTQVTGTPVRSTLVKVNRSKAAEYWGLNAERLIITIIGGSQGARGLNQLLIDSLPLLKKFKTTIQVIHQTGKEDQARVKKAYEQAEVKACVVDFCKHMEMLYSLSDLMIARSGAASLTEISYFGLPSLLVPYPHAAEDHQTFNAQVYVNAGASVLVQENLLGAELLSKTLEEWITCEKTRHHYGKKAASFAAHDAAQRVAQEVEHVL